MLFSHPTRRCAAGHTATHFLEHILTAIGAFCEDLGHRAIKPLSFFRRQLFRGQDNYRNGAPLLTLAEYSNERKTVYSRHHEIEHDKYGPLLGHALQGHTPILSLNDGPSLFSEQAPEHAPWCALVLDEQQRRRWLSGSVFVQHGAQTMPINRLGHVVSRSQQVAEILLVDH